MVTETEFSGSVLELYASALDLCYQTILNELIDTDELIVQITMRNSLDGTEATVQKRYTKQWDAHEWNA